MVEDAAALLQLAILLSFQIAAARSSSHRNDYDSYKGPEYSTVQYCFFDPNPSTYLNQPKLNTKLILLCDTFRSKLVGKPRRTSTQSALRILVPVVFPASAPISVCQNDQRNYAQ